MKESEIFFIEQVRLGTLTVNRDGTIYNNKTKRYIGAASNHGYMKISMMMPNTYKIVHIQIHRLVYLIHKGEIKDGFVIDHIDNDRTNNSIENLQVLTLSENSKKAFVDGLMKGAFKLGNQAAKGRKIIGNQYGKFPKTGA